jgi:DNA invertase Pin-like site-specific DNA recombinase
VKTHANRILADEVAALRSELAPKLARTEAKLDQVLALYVGRGTRAEQAKALGVHPSTLRRRENRQRAKILANG